MTVSCPNWHSVRPTGALWIGKVRCMNPAQAVEMSGAPSNVVHMSKMIQLRNVPDELHRALKASAAAEGMSLSDYIKRELADLTGRASLDEIDARIRARGPSNLETDWVVQVIREARGD